MPNRRLGVGKGDGQWIVSSVGTILHHKKLRRGALPMMAYPAASGGLEGLRRNRRRHTRVAFESLLGIVTALLHASYRDFVDQRV